MAYGVEPETSVLVADTAVTISQLGSVNLQQTWSADATGDMPKLDESGREIIYRAYDPVKGFDYYVAERLCGLMPAQALKESLANRKRIGERFMPITMNQLRGLWLVLPINDVVADALNLLASQQGLDLQIAQRGLWIMSATAKIDKDGVQGAVCRTIILQRISNTDPVRINVDLGIDSVTFR